MEAEGVPPSATEADASPAANSPTTPGSGAATNDVPATPKRFRAIIVGGGPNGLGMAHALTLAGIDYVLLERSQHVVNPDGASIALWPHSVRIMDQFGLLDEARALSTSMKDKYNVLPDGTVRDSNRMFEQVEVNHGHPWMLFRRTKLLGLLHQSLPDKEERILTNKHVTRIETHDDGVSVLCKDGSIMEGSIVVGCDGVHSRVRQILREKQLLSGQRPTDSKKPMKTTYNGLVGLCPLPASLKTGTVWECRGGKGRSFHILTGPEDAYFFVYQRLDKPHYERPRYTDEDAEALARNVMDHPVTDHLKFSDLWKAKKWATLVDYQEGFLDRWCGERVVLVGDSVHKATPNAGLSLNTGWQGMAELTNRLRALLLTDASPDTETLTALFEGYQESRKKIAKATMSFSGLYTRVVAWDNAAYRFADWLAPKVGGDILLLNHLASPIISRSITFDFVEEKEHKEGKIRWKNPPKTNGKSRK